MLLQVFTYIALAGAGCASPESRRAVVTVEMTASKMLIVRTVDPRNPGFPTEYLQPGSTNYGPIQKMVGGISPGESKVMPEFIGRVDMAMDGTLTYEFWSPDQRGGPSEGQEVAHPGDLHYEDIRSLVSKIEPGGWAMVPALRCK